MKKRLLPLLLSGVSCLMLTSCGLLPEEDFYAVPTIANVERAVYTTVPCVRGDVIHEVSVTCKYVPVQTANLFFAEKGCRFDTYYVSVGESVEEGQLLAQMDLEDLEEQIEKLETEKQNCNTELTQLEEKRELALKRQCYQATGANGTELQEALDSVNRQYDRSRRDLEDRIYVVDLRLQEYTEKLSERRIYAPFSGVVTYAYEFDPSELVDGYKKVLTISDSSVSLFRAETSYWPYFSIGDIYTVSTDDRDYTAHVIDPAEYNLTAKQVEGKSGDIYLALDEPAMNLPEGGYGKISLVLAESRDTLYVPAKAVSSINGQTVIYRLGEDGYRIYSPVTTGVSNGKYIEILDGLQAGDEVIVN